jgi:hypothetical protein
MGCRHRRACPCYKGSKEWPGVAFCIACTRTCAYVACRANWVIVLPSPTRPAPQTRPHAIFSAFMAWCAGPADCLTYNSCCAAAWVWSFGHLALLACSTAAVTSTQSLRTTWRPLPLFPALPLRLPLFQDLRRFLRNSLVSAHSPLSCRRPGRTPRALLVCGACFC